MQTLHEKIKNAGLSGRGGSGFPTYLKWEFAKNIKYLICNVSEGELAMFKDFYILDNFAERVFEGMIYVMDYFKADETYINFNSEYYKKLKSKIDPLVNKYKKKGYKFKIFLEHPSYIGGEETALLNAIEGKRVEPRMKPPFPIQVGLYGKPTLVHNVETLYNIADVAEGKFEDKRFYCISGKGIKNNVYHLPAEWSIEHVLKETGNIPSFDFFVQIGGGASGLVINKAQIKKEIMIGAGAIEIYPTNTKPRDMLIRWFTFYKEESCGNCTPCREGTYQLYRYVKNYKVIPWKKIFTLVDLMEEASFCALGKSIARPVKSYMKNILKKKF